MGRLTKCAVNYIRKHIEVSDEQLEIVEYGISALLSNLLGVTLIVALGIVFNSLTDTLIFAAFFIGIRRFTGGYHAKTRPKCAFLTSSVVLSYILISKLNLIYFWPAIGICAVSLVIVFLTAPVENPNKYLSDLQKKRYKLFSVLLVIFYTAAIVIAYMFFKRMCFAIYYSLLMTDLLIGIQKVERRFK